jgi:hypothetical protein
MTAPALDRLIFRTSRLAEFCSQRELINQTGHGVEDWPLVVLKEVIDNALDACEEADIAPVIEIVISDDVITVVDKPESRLTRFLDFTARVSSREAYVSPTRAQGNALKTLLAMRGETAIESRGLRTESGSRLTRSGKSHGSPMFAKSLS